MQHYSFLGRSDGRFVASALAMAIGTAALAFAMFAAAQSSHREHGAHEHGSGALNIVVEKDELLIELRFPGVNVVGFEHAPGSEKDRAAINKALAVFRDPARLFIPNAKAGCVVEHVEAAIGAPDKASHDDTKKESSTDAHTELHAEYHFACSSPQHLQSVKVKVFEHLLDVIELDAQVITERWQGIIELTPNSDVLRLGDS